jgi:tetratricopeptide (TPR) repeat protein
LPTPAQADLPSPARFADLPSPAAGLPALAADLPSPSSHLNPFRGAQRADEADQFGGIITQGHDPFADVIPHDPFAVSPDAPQARISRSSIPPALRGVVKAQEGVPAFPGVAESDRDVPSDPFGHDGGSAFSAVPKRSSDRPRTDPPAQPAVGETYGEVDLGGDEAGAFGIEAEPAERTDDGMEFGGVPQEDADKPKSIPSSFRPRLSLGSMPEVETDGQRKKRQRIRLAFAGVFVLLVGGGSLTVVPAAGPFGVHFLMDQVQKGSHEELLKKTIGSVQQHFAADTFDDAREAIKLARKASESAVRYKPLAAYSAYVGYASALRFGHLPEVEAKSAVVLEEFAQAEGIAKLDLAQAAAAAATGNLARARQLLDSLAASNPKDPAVLGLRGELQLKEREFDKAAQTWELLGKAAPTAQSLFGLARVADANRDEKKALELVEQVLKLNPTHIDGRILLARLLWSQGNENKAIEELNAVVGNTNSSSPRELVDAQTELGNIHLGRGRVSQAEKAFLAALEVNAKASNALRGLGDALYTAGRFTEALGRFDAAVEADPQNILARIGVGKTKIALEQLDDAKTVLVQLNQEHPKDEVVAYWYGQLEEALGNGTAARDAYKRAIEIGGDKRESVRAYVALALLQSQAGDFDGAAQTLASAQKRLPDSPEIHLALGDVAMTQTRFEAALEEYKRALKLDNNDVEARFKSGSALRRLHSFDQALDVFDQVAKVDADFPGLALERGLLYEEWGRIDEALKEYEAALAKAPNDLDLMLHVGCARVGAGNGTDAEQILRKVINTSIKPAESSHCLGRALLLKGEVAEALRLLQRAVDLAPKRPEYHLYLAWAANEAGRIPQAEEEIRIALELDQGLADAYWQRGMLRHRQGALNDAIVDLNKALELRPSRVEAHAELAGVFTDLGQEQKALSEWQIATQGQPNNAAWHFRYGKLLAENLRNAEAATELLAAIDLAKNDPNRPTWLPQAHLYAARSLGPAPQAAEHWQAFLEQAPTGSPYIEEARRALSRAGRPMAAP